MSQCKSCGTAIDQGVTSCPACGAAAQAGTPPPPPPPSSPPPPPPSPAVAAPAVSGAGAEKPYASEDTIHLFLAYFGIFSLIPYLIFKDKKAEPKKEYVFWHARQGLALGLTVIALWVAQLVMTGMLIFVSYRLVRLMSSLFSLAYLVAFVLMIIGWIKAFGGEKYKLPLIDKIVDVLPS